MNVRISVLMKNGWTFLQLCKCTIRMWFFFFFFNFSHLKCEEFFACHLWVSCPFFPLLITRYILTAWMTKLYLYVLWSVYIAQRKGLKLFHRHGGWMIWLHVLILKDDCNKFEIWNDWFIVYVYLYFTTGRHVFGLKSEIYHEEKRIQEISCWVQEKIHTIL